MTLTVGELFAGIGGFGLGLERAGMKVIWHSEIDPYASAVLRKHWPEVPNHGDIRSIRGGNVERPDVLCGGFPCQDISNAGKRAGIDGERSGLWSEYARVIGELRPRYVIVENVSALLGRGLERVLGDLAALGFDAEWHCIPARAAGAEHERDRLWVIAHANGERELQPQGGKQEQRRRPSHRVTSDAANANAARRSRRGETRTNSPYVDALREGLRSACDAAPIAPREHWDHQPVLGRGVHGVPNRLDRIAVLGNAVYPLIPEIIGRAIMSEDSRATKTE